MIIIFRSLRDQEAIDRALVLLSMGIEHEIDQGMFGTRLAVPAHAEAQAREQLRLWESENNRSRPLATHVPAQPGTRAAALAWSALLLFAYGVQVRYAFDIDWVTAGRVDVAAVRAGEWWRAVTALTLHADIAHVLVNIGFGAVFVGLLARETGGGLAACLILLCGAGGNLMNVALQRAAHTSIGASTAVFAALGLLAAWLWLGRRLDQTGWARRSAPLVGAIVLLGWLGTGDERTDTVAHLTGFVAGFIAGAVLGLRAGRLQTSARREAGMGAGALAAMVMAWWFALR